MKTQEEIKLIYIFRANDKIVNSLETDIQYGNILYEKSELGKYIPYCTRYLALTITY